MPSSVPDPHASDSELATLRGDPELARTFFAETFDHLGSIEASVLALEVTPGDRKALDEVFRPFHTLKANAGALGIDSVEELAHHVEDLLDRARSGEQQIGDAEVEIVLAAVDLLTSMIHDVEARLAGRDATDFGPKRAAFISAIEGLRETIRADQVPAAVPSGEDPGDDDRLGPATAASGPRVDGSSPATVKVDTRKLDSLVDLVGELAIVQSMIHQDPQLQGRSNERLNRNLAQLLRITGELQTESMAMRLVPIRQTFKRMSRLVRDLSRKSGKALELVVSGEETELDRKVVEEISDPLMHMLRNSVDHGIEDPETRRRAGKPPRGRLSLSAYHKGGNVVIAVADDGGGLDTEKLQQRAVAQKLFEPGAIPTEAEIHALIFRPGFSTASEVTDISGRGVGMDVVRRNVETLRGRIEIRSQPGIGTTFFIKLPLTLATVEGLILGVGDQRFVLPTFSVRESLRPSPDRVHRVPGQGWIVQVRGDLLPLARLADLFGIGGAVTEPSEGVVVVLEDDLQCLALIVDELLGKQEIVIKSLGEALVSISGVAGAAILADGRISLILDAGGLMTLQRNAAPRAA
jgi:two-component system, chemotaxis family, sensor kinase CheA